MNYYNEFDHHAAEWLRNLIDAGKIPQGDVDDRSITEVDPDELRRYTQCHFFAGIAGWSYALQLAGWPSDRPIWTGSCPCQPFSTAGKQKGKADERHLWPVWFNLIREYRPPVIFGEQVAAAITHGWLDEVATDLEAEGYAIGAAIIPACSVGAPHKRDRLWFVAKSESDGRNEGQSDTGGSQARISERRSGRVGYGSSPLGDSTGKGLPNGGEPSIFRQKANAEHERCGCDGNVANSDNTRPQGYGRFIGEHDKKRREESPGLRSENSFWDRGQFIECPDGKKRLVEPSIRLLANGVSGRVVKLRALGNAIVPQVAAAFIKSFLELGEQNDTKTD